MPITLKIRPLDSKFKTSVYKVSSRRNGKLRNGEKVCLGKPVEKEGQFNYAVYKVSDSNAIVDNLGSITADQGDLSGEENNSQKLNSLEENIWNTLKAPERAETPKGPLETPKGSLETPKGPKDTSNGSKDTSKGSSETPNEQEDETPDDSEKEEAHSPTSKEDDSPTSDSPFKASEQASEAETPAAASPKGPFEATLEASESPIESETAAASPSPILMSELKKTKTKPGKPRLKTTKKKPIEILL